MTKNNAVVAIYLSHMAVETANKQAQQSRFNMKKLWDVGGDYHTDKHAVGYYNVDDRMKVWGQTVAFWGGLGGLLIGSAFFWMPGLRPFLVEGPLVSWIVVALESAIVVGGLSAIGTGLPLCILRDGILSCETATDYEQKNEKA